MLSLSLTDDRYPTLDAERAALFGAADYIAKEHYTDFIDRFVDIIGNPNSVSPAMRNYLLTEGGHQSLDGLPLGVPHLLYWLDRQLKTKLRDTHEAYVDRLSEATDMDNDWGSATPDTLADADPLNLHEIIGDMDIPNPHFCVVIDNDAADDEDQESLEGCVVVTYRGGSSHPCTTIGGLAKDNNGSGGLFTSATEEDYEYHFWKSLDCIHEQNGGVRRFPIGATSNCFVLVRWAEDHQISREIVLLKQTTVDDAARITIMGYPGEFPVIRMGNSTSDGASGAAGDQNDLDASVAGVGIASGATPLPAMITVGNGVNTGRANVHFRNIDFIGNRDQTGGSGQIFASRIFRITTTATGGSIRRCRFTGTQFIRSDDPIIGFDTLRDAVFLARSAPVGVDECGGVDIFASGYVFDSNRIEPVAIGDWPGNEIDPTNMAAVWLDVNADNVRVTRNKFTGVKANSMIRYGRSSTTARDGAYIADNYVEVYDKNGIDVFSVSNSIIERNYCTQFARDDVGLDGGGSGIQVGHSESTIVRHNVVVGVEGMLRVGGGINFQAGATFPDLDLDVYGNIAYRSGISISAISGEIASVAIHGNLVAGMKEIRKTALSALNNSPFSALLPSTDGTLEGIVTYDGNQVWRFEDGTPDQETIEAGPHLTLYDSGSTTAAYEVDDVLAGWTNNFAAKPDWAGDPETGDFRLAASSIEFPADMPFTEALSRAWSPSEYTPVDPEWGAAENMGNRPTSANWQENSGIAAGVDPTEVAANRNNTDYVWHISDGSLEILLAQSIYDGADGGTWALASGTAVDVEDVASRRVGGVNYVYLADIGDNSNARSTIQIFRCIEPRVWSDPANSTYPFGTELVRHTFDNTLVNAGTGGATYDGAFSGNATYSATAKFGSHSLTGDGTGDGVDSLFGSGRNPTTASFTVSGWFRWAGTGSGTTQHIFGVSSTADNRRFYARYRHTTGQWGYRVQGAAEVLSDVTVVAGTWYHIAMVADAAADEVRFYVNGVLKGTTSITSYTLSANIYIGTNRENGSIAHAEGFQGLVDDFSIYESALSATQIQDIVLKGLTAGAHGGTIPAGDIHTITCEYPGGGSAPSHKDAETLLADSNGDLYVITKRITPARVYRLAHAASYTGTQTLEYVGEIWTPPETVGMDGTNAGYYVGGDISANGRLIVLRGYENVYWWHRAPGQTLLDALSVAGTAVPTYVGKGNHPTQEPKGEGVCLTQDGDLVTTSEYLGGFGSGSGYPTFRYPRTQ